MYIKSALLVCISALIYYIVEVNGIKCFQCNSGEHAGCEELRSTDVNSPYYRECLEAHDNATIFCRKTKYTILDRIGFTRVTRECGWILHKNNESRCYDVDTDFKYETSCQCFTDGCNGVSKLSSHLFISLAAVLGMQLLM